VPSCAALEHLAAEKNEENRRPGPAIEQEDANQIDNEKQEPAIGPSFSSGSRLRGRGSTCGTEDRVTERGTYVESENQQGTDRRER
jgi:hypothetical protein